MTLTSPLVVRQVQALALQLEATQGPLRYKL